MFRIGANKIDALRFGNKPEKLENQEKVQKYEQNKEITNVQPTYNVKTPMIYQQLEDIKLPNDLIAKSYKLANGQKVIILPKKGITTVKTYVNTGSMNEPDNLRGISHYIEHNLFNGSRGLKSGEFFQRVHEMGGNTNASTGFAETNYYISSNLFRDTDLEEMIKLHSSMLESPNFSPEMLEKEKGIVNSEINMIISNVENVGVNKAIKNLYQIKTRSTDMIGGTTNNITNLTRDDVVNYYNNNYYPANMTTVISGDVNPDETMKLVSKYFSSMQVPNKPQKFEELKLIDKNIREDLISDKATATYLTIAINAPKNSDLKEKLALNCAMEALVGGPSSRINKEFINDGFSVSYDSDKIGGKPTDNTVSLLVANSTGEAMEKALNVIYKETQNFSKNPITEDELNSIKQYSIKCYYQWFEGNEYINSKLGSALLNGNLDEIQNYEKVMNSITVDDVKKVAEKYLRPNNFSVVMVHPAETTEQEIKDIYNKVNNGTNEVSFTGNNEHAKVSNKSVQKQSIRKFTPVDMDKVNLYELPNKFKLITNDDNSKISYIALNLNLNEINDKYEVEGEVFRRLLDLGTMKRDAVVFSKTVKDDGISISNDAGSDYISISADGYGKDISKVFDTIKEMLYLPRITQKDFETVKQNIKDDLTLREKSVVDKLNEKLYPNLFNGMPDDKIIEKLDKMTLDDVKNFYKDFMEKAQGSIVVSGPFSKDKVFSETVKNNVAMFSPVDHFECKLLNRFKPVEKKEVLTDVHSKNQAEIIEHFSFKNNDNIKDTATVHLLNTILGGTASSRLFLDLREKQQLAYGVRSHFGASENDGYLDLSIETTTENKETGEVNYDNVKKSIDGFNKHINKLKTEKVPEEELENAKISLKNNILSGCETSSGINYVLSAGMHSPYGLTCTNRVFDILDKITPEDIYNAANYIFNGNPLYSVLATENTLKANQDYFKTLEA